MDGKTRVENNKSKFKKSRLYVTVEPIIKRDSQE